MRTTTLLSVAVLGLSTAAIAQVTSQPPQRQDNAVSANAQPMNDVVEDKVPVAGATATPAENAANAAAPPGEPEAATSAPPRG